MVKFFLRRISINSLANSLLTCLCLFTC
jgi:hypothetical protein